MVKGFIDFHDLILCLQDVAPLSDCFSFVGLGLLFFHV